MRVIMQTLKGRGEFAKVLALLESSLVMIRLWFTPQIMECFVENLRFIIQACECR